VFDSTCAHGEAGKAVVDTTALPRNPTDALLIFHFPIQTGCNSWPRRWGAQPALLGQRL